MDIFHRIEETLNSGDEIVRSWFLVKSNYFPIISCSCYALFSSVIGPAIMKNREPFDLRKTMVVFNFFVVAVYVYVLVVMLHLFEVDYEKFCKGSSVQESDVREVTVVYKLARAAWLIYVIKYVEFLDTVFFILRKKYNLISFLHVFHHSIIPMVGWILIRTETSGYQIIPVLINGFVHVIMYTYYGLAAMGPQVRKYLWWKKYLTQLQIIQFIIIIVFTFIIAPMSGCAMVQSSYALNVFLGTVFLFLFYKFYRKTFTPKILPNSTLDEDACITGTQINGGASEMEEKQLATHGRQKKE